MTWIQTFTGRKIVLDDVRPEDIDILDIARHLSQICRFTGACKTFYSVAQHSVLVSQYCSDPRWGLLHDAHEYITGDMSRPLKAYLMMLGVCSYDDFEEQVQNAVCDRFGLPHEMPADVKHADMLLLATEARDLMAPLHPDWAKELKGWPTLPDRIEPWSSGSAEWRFLERFNELFPCHRVR